MKLFHRIEDAKAIVRVKGGVFKQVDVYHRGEQVYVPHGAGYVRVDAKLGDHWGTTSPSVNVIEFGEAAGLDFARGDRWSRPVWRGGQ